MPIQSNVHINPSLFVSIRQQLVNGEVISIKSIGSSMWPFVCNGDVLLIKRVSIKEIVVGDVVLTFNHGCLLCHRVLRKGSDSLQTKPDALPGIDLAVKHDDVLGLVVGKMMRGKMVPSTRLMQRLSNFCILYVSFLTAPILELGRIIKSKVNGQ